MKFRDALETCDFSYEKMKHFSLYSNESLAQGETQTLLEVKFFNVASQIQSELFSKLIIDITYESMYGESNRITLKDDEVVTS